MALPPGFVLVDTPKQEQTSGLNLPEGFVLDPNPKVPQGGGWIPTVEEIKHEGFLGRTMFGKEIGDGKYSLGALSSDSDTMKQADANVFEKFGEAIKNDPVAYHKAYNEEYKALRKQQSAAVAAEEKAHPSPGVGEALKQTGKAIIENPVEMAKGLTRGLIEDPEMLVPAFWEAAPAKLLQIVDNAGKVGKAAYKVGRVGATGAAMETIAQTGEEKLDPNAIATTAANFAAFGLAHEGGKAAVDAIKKVRSTAKAEAEKVNAEQEQVAPEAAPVPKAAAVETEVENLNAQARNIYEGVQDPTFRGSENDKAVLLQRAQVLEQQAKQLSDSLIAETKPAPVAEAPKAAETLSSHDREAMLAELRGEEIKPVEAAKPAEPVKPVEAPAPAAVQELPPGFERFEETQPDGSIKAGVRRIEEKPAESALVETPEVKTEVPAMEMAKAAAESQPTKLPQFPNVDSIPGITLGPAGLLKPRVIAAEKPLYHETNIRGLNNILGDDNRFEYKSVFVTDNPDLAIGQGENKGIKVKFRPNSVSGEENYKPGTAGALGDIAGREYKSDILAPRAIERIDVIDKKALDGIQYNPSRFLQTQFERIDNKDGSFTFIRKGMEAPKAEEKAPPALDQAAINRQRQQAKKQAAKAAARKSDTLITRLIELGGISLKDKLDITGEDKAMLRGGYSRVFKKDAKNRLIEHVQDGSLDDLLPYEMRRQTADAMGQLHDGTAGFEYLADRMANGETVRPYEIEEAEARKAYEEKQQAEFEQAQQAKPEDVNAELSMAAAEEQGITPPLELEGQTPEQIRLEEESRRAAQEADAKEAAKVAAQEGVDDFALTGSNREADLAAARGAQDLFAAEDARFKQAMATINTGVQQRTGAIKNVVPEDRISGKDMLNSLADVIYIAIKRGARSMAEATRIAREQLGDAAKKFTNENFKRAYAMASQRYLSESKQPRNIKGKPVEPSWLSPAETRTERESKVDTLLYAIQDNQRDTKLVQKAIEKAGREIPEQFNVYEKEQLYHGRTASKMRDFLLKDVLPVVKDMDKLKVTPEEINEYLHNRHAEEYNKQMNAKNPDVVDPNTGDVVEHPLKDRGSGIHTEDARNYLASIEPEKKAALEKIADQFYKMVKDTQEVLVESGDVSRDTVNLWNDIYKDYVPLQRVSESDSNVPGASGAGRGFAVRGQFTKRAMGSLKEVDDIIGNIIAAHERAIVRAEKMRVGKAVYGLAIENPNPDFWLPINPDALKNPELAVRELEQLGVEDPQYLIKNLMEEPKERYLKKVSPDEMALDEEGRPVGHGNDVVASKINVMNRYKDYAFPVKINGKDRYVFFNQNDPNAMRMVKSLKNLDPDTLDIVLRGIGKYTTWFKNVNTQYNPVFGFVNLFRDTGGALFNLSTTKIADRKAEVISNIPSSMSAVMRVLRDERKGITDTKGEWAEIYKQARSDGFQAGHRDSLVRRRDEERIISEKLAQNKSGNTKKAFKEVIGALSDFNDMMETATRLSAYKAAIDKGLTRQEAAIIAKNLTVNFDKRGQIAPTVGALYAFFNASVQGTARIVETLQGPAGKKIIAGGIGLGVIQSFLLSAAGFDENDPPEFVREKNFIVPTGDGKYITIPYPLGFNVLPNIGRVTTDMVMTGGDKMGKRSLSLISSIVDSFNPVGGSNSIALALAPTIFDMPLSLAMNKDSFGRPISREDTATNPTPGWTRSREGATETNKKIAEFLNDVSGGTKYKKGSISPTADQLDYIVGQTFGGIGRETLKAAEAVKSVSTGEELPSYRVPLVSRFAGETGSNAAVTQTFYNNITEMAQHEHEIKGRRKNHEDVVAYKAENPQSKLWRMANTKENEINEINKKKRELQAKGAAKERILKLEERKIKVMKQFNDRVKKAEEAAKAQQ